MAKREEAFASNAPGAFWVDRTCIDCGTCYTLVPELYRAAGSHSLVHRQPQGDRETLRASMALLACPTASIGTSDRRLTAAAAREFPIPLEDEVGFCGYTSEKSYGAWSYFIRRPLGNVLMDSPRAAEHLLRRIKTLGGVSLMVLSHRDDVADHAAFRRRFACERVMHRDDGLSGLERYVSGEEPVALAADLLLIPTPGHTAGSMCLLYRDTFLFTGDHLWWSPEAGRLSASRSLNWHSWSQQLRSLEKLLDFEFRWVLPGHGAPWRADSRRAMRAELERALAYLRAA